jgi:hypothetical protein
MNKLKSSFWLVLLFSIVSVYAAVPQFAVSTNSVWSGATNAIYDLTVISFNNTIANKNVLVSVPVGYEVYVPNIPGYVVGQYTTEIWNGTIYVPGSIVNIIVVNQTKLSVPGKAIIDISQTRFNYSYPVLMGDINANQSRVISSFNRGFLNNPSSAGQYNWDANVTFAAGIGPMVMPGNKAIYILGQTTVMNYNTTYDNTYFNFHMNITLARNFTNIFVNNFTNFYSQRINITQVNNFTNIYVHNFTNFYSNKVNISLSHNFTNIFVNNFTNFYSSQINLSVANNVTNYYNTRFNSSVYLGFNISNVYLQNFTNIYVTNFTNFYSNKVNITLNHNFTNIYVNNFTNFYSTKMNISIAHNVTNIFTNNFTNFYVNRNNFTNIFTNIFANNFTTLYVTKINSTTFSSTRFNLTNKFYMNMSMGSLTCPALPSIPTCPSLPSIPACPAIPACPNTNITLFSSEQLQGVDVATPVNTNAPTPVQIGILLVIIGIIGYFTWKDYKTKFAAKDTPQQPIVKHKKSDDIVNPFPESQNIEADESIKEFSAYYDSNLEKNK